VADEVIDWAEAEYKAKRSPEPYVSNLLHLVDGEWKLFERIPARYHKQLGLLAMDRRDWTAAIVHFERAEALYESIGVGTRLAGARKALLKVQASGSTDEIATRLDEVLPVPGDQDPSGNYGDNSESSETAATD